MIFMSEVIDKITKDISISEKSLSHTSAILMSCICEAATNNDAHVMIHIDDLLTMYDEVNEAKGCLSVSRSIIDHLSFCQRKDL